MSELGEDVARNAEARAELSTSAQLRQAQQDLAASQADLTRVEQQRDRLLETVAKQYVEIAKLRGAQADAERARDESLRSRSWQVARESDVLNCWGCTRFIKRGEAVEPVPSMKGHFQHVHCPDSPPNSGAGPREEHP